MLRNSTISDLHLQENQISTAGAMAIAEMLQVNKTLRILDLFDNQINDHGKTFLLRILPQHPE